MATISRLTPTHYRNRHSDWYYGTFRAVCHQIGLIGETLFWLDCEGKANFIKGIIPFPFEIIEIPLINVLKYHYKAKYVNVYDEWALQACKFFENVEGQITGAIDDLRNQFNTLLEDAKRKLQIQLNELYGIVDKANLQLASLESAKNNLIDVTNDLEARVRALEAQKLPQIKVPTLRELLMK